MRGFAFILFITSLSLCQDLMGQESAADIERYVSGGDTWLSDRLMMHWNTHATDHYINLETYSKSTGKAPVPTLMMNGHRHWSCNYANPRIEDLKPRFEDSRGLWLQNVSTPDSIWEWAAIKNTGCVVSNTNTKICETALQIAKHWQDTGDERYARSAWSVLYVYMTGLIHTNVPTDISSKHSYQHLYGIQTMQAISESTLPPLTHTYEILRPWIAELENRPQAIDSIEAGFKRWADVIQQQGNKTTNWDVLQAGLILDVAVILQPNAHYKDGKGQEYYLNIFEHDDTQYQLGIEQLLLTSYNPETGIWPECPSYSLMVLENVADFVKTYRERLNLNLCDRIPIIGKAARANIEYIFPDSLILGFGDTHVEPLNQNLYDKLGIDMKTLNPSRSFYSETASWLVQRSGMDRMGSLAFAISGALGQHMHASGPSLELYGRGLRIAPDAGMGLTRYGTPNYEEYYTQFPAHNTVCINGISTYPCMTGTLPFKVLLNEERKINGNGDATVQAAEVTMAEPKTSGEQQRLVVMVSTSASTGYFIDVFRSKSSKTNTCHDYFYHNLGQDMVIYDANTEEPLQMTAVTTLAPSVTTPLKAYEYLKSGKKNATTSDLKVIYTIHPDFNFMTEKAKSYWPGDITMTQWMRGESNRTTFQCLAPATENLKLVEDLPYDVLFKKGSDLNETNTFIARQAGEAWTHPFVSVFEPASQDLPGTIKCVSWPQVTATNGAVYNNSVAILVEHKDGQCQLIVSSDSKDAIVHVMGWKFTGRLNVVALKKKADQSGYVLAADLNEDLRCDESDSIILQNHIMEIEEITDPDKLVIADTNCDGKISVADVTSILAGLADPTLQLIK